MSHAGADQEEGKLDLVPLIDTVMLLLMFFIMTSKFTTEEKAISSLLPTDKGQMASTPTKPVEEPKQVNILIFPAGMEPGLQPSGYRDQLQRMRATSGENIDQATIRIGGDRQIIDGNVLSRHQNTDRLKDEINKIHSQIGAALEKYENGEGERNKQVPVIIHCFSGMSWRFALVAYDAVRYYEANKTTVKYTGKPEEMNLFREVTFAPPRIRNYSANELGNELFEIVHMK
jgi:biopolymer transport protein ExbD